MANRGIVGASALLFVFAFELDRNPAGAPTESPEDNI
jgi:hypothetical protein